MNDSTLVATLSTLRHTRATPVGRQVTTAATSLAGEYLVDDAGLSITVQIDARRAAGEVLVACKVGELVAVTGRVTKHEWVNRRGRAGEKWSIAAKQVERTQPSSDAAAALGLETSDSPIALHGAPDVLAAAPHAVVVRRGGTRAISMHTKHLSTDMGAGSPRIGRPGDEWIKLRQAPT